MKSWIIIADDLTGAADCAVTFSRHGLHATVGWGCAKANFSEKASVFSYNADSRELSVDETSALQRELLEQFWDKNRFLYRKIDSTLRGQPAADIAQTLSFIKAQTGRAIGILAPAFPAMGRITQNGHIFVNGKTLEESELWQRDHTYPTSDLKAIIEQYAHVPCVTITLDKLRDTPEKLSQYIAQIKSQLEVGVLAFDAQTQDDLAAIAQLFSQHDPSIFFIGSGGLAHAFANLTREQVKEIYPIKNNQGGLMVVVGSLAHASRAASKKLAAIRDINHFLITPDVLLEGGCALESFVKKIVASLKNGANNLIEIAITDDLDMTLGPKLAKNLAQALKDATPFLSGIAATGGETASALLEAFGVHGISLHDEIDTGISLGLTQGDIEIPVATKAGAFGDEMSLVHIFDKLAQIKLEGQLG